jgi:hypothetical protein
VSTTLHYASKATRLAKNAGADVGALDLAAPELGYGSMTRCIKLSSSLPRPARKQPDS